ncbi:MAG: MMPL family transporter [Candidatus Thermoplasmatota archaeon]|nr:MMPL family transporter [Candidatus Thermoplasmatota archaeon]
MVPIITEKVGCFASRHPWLVIGILALITVGAVTEMILEPMEQKFDNEDFLPDIEAARTWTTYQEKFTSSYMMTILLKSPQGDVVTVQGFKDMVLLSENISRSESFRTWQDPGSVLQNPSSPAGSLYSLRDAVDQAEDLKGLGDWIGPLIPLSGGLSKEAESIDDRLNLTDPADAGAVSSSVQDLTDALDDLLRAYGSGPPTASESYGGELSYITSFASDQELKDEIAALISYDAGDPSVLNGSVRSQYFLGAAQGVPASLDRASDALNAFLGGTGLSAGSRQRLKDLLDDIDEAKGYIANATSESIGRGSLLRYGYVQQSFGTSLFTLTNFLTKDFDPAKGSYKAKGALLIVSLNYTLTELSVTDESLVIGIEGGIKDAVGRMDRDISLSVHPLGNALVNKRINDASNESMTILLPLAFFMIILILGIVYRSVSDVIVNLIGLTMAILWMFGLGSLLGYYNNPMISAVPVLVVGLGIDYGIHLTLRYREEILKGKKVIEALSEMSGSVGVALLLATFTTVLAFMSNLFSPVGLLQQFSVLSAAGVMASFLIMFTFVPAVKSLIDGFKAKRCWNLFQGVKEGTCRAGMNGRTDPSKRIVNRAITRLALGAEKRPLIIIIVILLLTGGMGYLASFSKVTFSVRDFLPDDLQEAKDLEFVLDRFNLGSSGEVGIVIIDGDLTDPDVLRAMNGVMDNVVDDRSDLFAFETTSSGVRPKADFLLYSMLNMANNIGVLDPDDPFVNSYDATFNTSTGLPLGSATNERIEEVLMKYYESYPSIARRVLYLHQDSFTSSSITFTVSAQDDADGRELERELRRYTSQLRDMEGSGIEDVSISGTMVLTAVIVDSLTYSQIWSIIITLTVSLVVLMVVFTIEERSPLIGLVATLPMVFCLIWIVGTMYILKIPLNAMTITIGSLTVGLGITYGIHITHRFLEDLRTTSDIQEATRKTLINTGGALMGAAGTTIAGFGLLVFALMPPLQQFGSITALSILYSFLSSVIVLPVLLMIWARAKMKVRSIRGGR